MQPTRGGLRLRIRGVLLLPLLGRRNLAAICGRFRWVHRMREDSLWRPVGRRLLTRRRRGWGGPKMLLITTTVGRGGFRGGLHRMRVDSLWRPVGRRLLKTSRRRRRRRGCLKMVMRRIPRLICGLIA